MHQQNGLARAWHAMYTVVRITLRCTFAAMRGASEQKRLHTRKERSFKDSLQASSMAQGAHASHPVPAAAAGGAQMVHASGNARLSSSRYIPNAIEIPERCYAFECMHAHCPLPRTACRRGLKNSACGSLCPVAHSERRALLPQLEKKRDVCSPGLPAQWQ